MASLRPILRLLRPFWKRVLLALFLSVLTIGSSVGLMMTAAWLISTAALQLGIASLGVAPTGVRFFGLSRALFRYLERLVSHDVTFRLLARLRVWFYTRLEPLSLVQRQSYRSGDLMARMVGDIEELQNFYQRVVSPPLVAVIITALMGLVFSLIDGWAALVLVMFMLGAGTILPLFTWWNGEHTGRALVDQRTFLNSHLVDTIQGLPDSVAYGYATTLQDRVNTLTGRLAQAEERMNRLDSRQNGLAVLLVNLAAISVLWVTVGRVEGVLLASLALGTIAAFEAITPLALMGQHLGQEQTAARRVLEIIAQTPTIPEPAPPLSPATDRPDLLLDQVTFRYALEDRPVLNDFSLDLPYGQHLLLTGPSGVGKSSLINILLRFADYQAGHILVGGIDLRAIAHEEVRQLFGVMAQRTHLFNTTIYENIRIGRKSAGREEVIAAARIAQVHNFIAALPQGYDTYVGEGGALLSGGERQRIALARMLLKDAPIWLLDEITANLDPITARQVMDAVFTAGTGRTLVVMTHRQEALAGHPFDQHLHLTGRAA